MLIKAKSKVSRGPSKIFPRRDVLHRTANGPIPALSRQILSFMAFSSSATADGGHTHLGLGVKGSSAVFSNLSSKRLPLARLPRYPKPPAHMYSALHLSHFARHCTTRRGSALAITTDVPTSALLPVLVSSSESPLAGKSSLFSCVFVAL